VVRVGIERDQHYQTGRLSLQTTARWRIDRIQPAQLLCCQPLIQRHIVERKSDMLVIECFCSLQTALGR